MLTYIPAAGRHHAAPAPWLQSYFLLSFADYFDRDNQQFGPLRVFNDDTIAPQNGFPQHPHSEMEVLTLVLEGEATHEDTLGNHTTLKAGDVQRLTAGTGVAHSEMNRAGQQLHLYQIWLAPSQKGLAPSYEQREANFLKSHKNQLVPIATGQRVLENVLYVNSNTTVYWGNFASGHTTTFRTFPIRLTFIYVRRGTLFVNGIELGPGDQARVASQEALALQAGGGETQFILLDLPGTAANY